VGKVEHLARRDEPALARDDPEVKEVVVVEPFHGGDDMSVFSIFHEVIS
jgi:hypothetical protein